MHYINQCFHNCHKLPILQAGSQRISESRPVSVIAFSHLLYLIFQHTLDFVAHGFLAGLAEISSPVRGASLAGAVVVESSVIFSLSINSPFHTIRFCYPSSQSLSPPLWLPWLLPPGNFYRKGEPAHTVPVCGHKSLRGQGLTGS